jgi:hypothetical protein
VCCVKGSRTFEICLSEFCLEVSEVTVAECKCTGSIRSDAPLLFVCACVCRLFVCSVKACGMCIDGGHGAMLCYVI